MEVVVSRVFWAFGGENGEVECETLLTTRTVLRERQVDG
jgi:hypothetical protein